MTLHSHQQINGQPTQYYILTYIININRNINGLKPVPWGITDKILKFSDVTPSITTFWALLVSQACNLKLVAI